MHLIIKCLFLLGLILMLNVNSANAQSKKKTLYAKGNNVDSATISAEDEQQLIATKAVTFRNTVKWNVTALLVDGYNLGYERQLYKFVSADAALKIRPFNSIPQRDFVIDRLYKGATLNAKNYMREAELQQTSLTVMLKFYLNFLNESKNEGYYLGLYSRLERNVFRGKLHYITPAETIEFTHLDITQLKAGVGLMLGYTTMFFSKRLMLDFYILGLQFADSRYNYAFSEVFTEALSQDIQSEIVENSKAHYASEILSAPNQPLKIQNNARLKQLVTFGVSVGFRF